MTLKKIIIVCLLTLITLRIYGQESDVPLNSLVLKNKLGINEMKILLDGHIINQTKEGERQGLWINYDLDNSQHKMSIINLGDTCVTTLTLDTIGMLKDKLFTINEYGSYNNGKKIGEWRVYSKEKHNLKFRIFYSNKGIVEKIISYFDKEHKNLKDNLVYILERDKKSKKFIVKWINNELNEEEVISIFNLR
ncbi:MAG TPA: hypothetical protein DD434_02825 [Bacteroidales bacterium]|nr:hypothetical protein [Bacteroidales bacterium]